MQEQRVGGAVNVFPARGNSRGGNSTVPWKQSPSPNRAVFVQPYLSWVTLSGVQALQWRTAPHGHGSGELPSNLGLGLSSASQRGPTRVGFPGSPPHALPPAHPSGCVQPTSSHKRTRSAGAGRKQSSGWQKKAEIGWEQWGFGEICRKRLERGLKSSSLLKIGGREDALC